MKTIRRIFRKILVLAIIPLTLFSGRPAGGCICADGQFKLFCHGNGCCSHTNQGDLGNASTESCCCSTHVTHVAGNHRFTSASGTVVRLAGMDRSKSCCCRLQLVPMVTLKCVTPNLVEHALVVEITDPLQAHVFKVEFADRRSTFDPGPPRARLSLLQHFLI